MPSNGTVGYDNVGDANQPSPIIWKDCPASGMVDDGSGYFFHEDFLGPPTGTLAAALDVSMISLGGSMALDADVATVLAAKAGERGGWLDVETDGDDNDAAALFTEPFANITKNSGQKIWLEAYVELGDTDADQGFFFGLVEEAGASRDVLADDVAATGVIGESLIGFLVDNGDDDAVDIVNRLDAGTVEVIASDVTNSTSIPADDRASLADDTPVKLGLRFDGIETISFFVNGVRVATKTVDDTVDTTKDMCAIMALKTGAAAAESFAVDWIRAGFLERC